MSRHSPYPARARLTLTFGSMRRTLRLLCGILLVCAYFVAAPFGYVAFACLAAFPTRDRDLRARLLQSIMHRAFVMMHAAFRWLGLLDYHPASLRHTIPEGPCVIVANHPSLVDVTAITAGLRFLASAVKPGLYRSAWAGPLLRQAAQFAGTDGGSASVSRVIDDAVDRLHRGHRVLFFPEGTRSPPDGGMLPFGRTAFEVAVRANVPVIPLVIRMTPTWLGKGQAITALPATPAQLRITVLPAVTPDTVGGCSRKLKEVVRRAIVSRMHESRMNENEDLDSDDAGHGLGHRLRQGLERAQPNLSSASEATTDENTKEQRGHKRPSQQTRARKPFNGSVQGKVEAVAKGRAGNQALAEAARRRARGDTRKQVGKRPAA